MDTLKIQNDLLQFSTYVAPINLSFNQFLLLGSAPLLVHTGSAIHAQALLPQLPQALGDRRLTYLFISHFESDECGGLSLLLQRYPDVQPLCSAVTSRQLSGFGITNNVLVQAPGQILKTPDGELEFIAYPSEMHLWEGLILFERTRAVLFSSDLFLQMGPVGGGPVTSDWKKQVDSLTLDKIPSPPALEKLQNTLRGLPVALIAPGHGPCIRL